MIRRGVRSLHGWITFGLWFFLVCACQTSPLEIQVDNHSSLPVCEVYFSPPQQADFGENQLGEGELIPSRGSHTFMLEAGEYDLLIRSCSEDTLYSEAKISQNRHIIIGGEGNALFRVTNQTAQEICYLYISTTEEWGNDRLGEVESILPGNKRVFFLPPALVHARVLDCEMNVIAEIRGVNLSNSYEWVISP